MIMILFLVFVILRLQLKLFFIFNSFLLNFN